MAQLINVKLSRFDSQPWGFRLQGGKDFSSPLVIQKVNGGSLAEKAGLQAGDALIRVNDVELFNLRHKEAQDALVRAGNSFELAVQRGGSTWKPTVTPVGPPPSVGARPGPAPVTKTSLAARPAAPAPLIGSAHNLSARPFAPQVNGALGSDTVKSIVNKQYNSPVGMYSEETIAETLSAQAEVLAGGVLGVNFKKNEKNYNAEKSEVFKMVQEIDKEPKEPEPAPSGPSYFSRASHAVGGRPTSPRPVTPLAQQLPPPGSVPSAPFGGTSTTTPAAAAGGGASEAVPKCGDCGSPIVGVFVRIKDKNLHVECFKCATCGTSLKNVGYYNINNKLYCDIHAKLVARQNPPAPNLEPVTIPPGSRIPSSTISSALASAAARPSPLSAAAPPPSRPLPTAAPVSPGSPQPGTLGPMPFHAPSSLAGPKPFGSVFSSTTARPAPGNNKFAWPPQQEYQTSSGPTATPLYIPPPHLLQNAPSQSDTIDNTFSSNVSQYSAPDRVSETPAVNVTPPQNTQTVGSDIPLQVPTQIQQTYNEPLESQASEISTLNFTQHTMHSNASEQIQSQFEHDNVSVCKADSSVTAKEKPLSRESSELPIQVNEQEMTEQQQSVQSNEVATLEQTHGTDMQQIPTQPEHGQPVMSNANVTEPQPQVKEMGGVENFVQQETKVIDQHEAPLTKTVRTVKVSEEYSHQTKEVEIVKASSGGVVTESIKTGSTESSMQQQSINQSIEVKQGTEVVTGSKLPIESQTNSVTSVDVSQITELEKNITKCEVQESNQILQHDIQLKEAQKIVSDYVTDQSKQEVETKCQEAKEINSFVSNSFQASDGSQLKPSPSMYQEVPQASKSPPPPPRSSPIDAQLQLPSFPHQKRMSMIEALTIAPEKEFSININITPSQTSVTQSTKPIQKMGQVHNVKAEVDHNFAKGRGFMPQQKVSSDPSLGTQGSRFPWEKKTEIFEQPKSQIKTQREEIKKKIENTSTAQQQVIKSHQDKGKIFSKNIASGLHGASALPYYQQDLERYQIQRALSPAPHFRVPGSRSPSPAPPVDTESFKHAYKFGAPLSPRGMHRSAKDLEGLTVQTELQGTLQKYTGQEVTQQRVRSETENLFQKDLSTFLLKPATPQNIPQQQHHDKTSDMMQKISSQKQASFGPQIKVATPFQQAGFQTQTAMPYPHIPFPNNQAVTHPQQTVSASETPVLQKSSFQSPSVMIQNVSSTPGATSQVLQKSSVQPPRAVVQNVSSIPHPTSQVPQKPSCTAVPPVGGGGGGGVGGGKAAASVAGSTAPRRGRGILNQPGARIPLCGSCNSQIRGPFITALGKIWCPDHFICANEQCRRPLQDIGFVEEKGKLYCEYCFEKYIAPTCDKCNSKIKGDCLNAIGKHFHPECFLCAYCGKLFGNSPFFLEDGLPYCEADWNELFTTKCFACGFPIEAGDRWVEALNNNYHSQCFNCTNCKKNLEGESFYAKGGRPFCKAHAR